jgi:hypothetical protein
MAEYDQARLQMAEQLRASLAVENELSRPQAAAFVRCLQTTWDVPRIAWGDRQSAEQLSDARRLLHAAEIFRSLEGPESAGATDCYRRAGELLEWLSRAQDGLRSIVPIELMAAAAYQLGRLPAMATGLLGMVKSDHAGVKLYAEFLRADFDRVIELAVNFWRENPHLTARDATEALVAPAADGDEDNVAWFFTVELVRAVGLAADCLRRGEELRLEQALLKLKLLDDLAQRTFSDDAALIVTLLRQTAEGFGQASIYKPLDRLGALNPEKRSLLRSYARGQFSRGRGILWTSQLQGLERLLTTSSFALCTPTGSGKTLVANLALIKELLLGHSGLLGSLALYLVPSRALAGEVEAKLKGELGETLLITGLYGGTDWGVTDFWLEAEQPTVLIATVEKAEALFRYLGPLLTARLRLLIIDEAHQVVPGTDETAIDSFAEHGNRAARLESFVARVLARRPDVVRIALTAVAGGASSSVAKWIEGRNDAEAVGVRYRSTRQIVGVLEATPGAAGRILLDVLNGKALYLQDTEQAVFIPLKTPPMPQLPGTMVNSLNRYNILNVVWTALHLAEEKQRILISVAQQPERIMGWIHAAFAHKAWRDAPIFTPPDGEDGERYQEALAACHDYCGEDSFELALLRRGIATSHGQMPQRLRRLMVEMIDKRICPITVATATLTEGVNLPFDLIFLTSLMRTRWNDARRTRDVTPMSIAEFRNLSGRAGRPGASRGIEGLTLIAIPTRISTRADNMVAVQRVQRRQLQADYDALRENLLVDERDIDRPPSPLGLLLTTLRDRARTLLGVVPANFSQWLEAALPTDISSEAGQGATAPAARLADSLDEMDSILIAALEELSGVDAAVSSPAEVEAILAGVWVKTFTAVASASEAWMEQAFIVRGRGIVETVYPDPAERRRMYQSGFSPVVGRRFEAAAPHILIALKSPVTYGDMSAIERAACFASIGAVLVADRGFGFRPRSTETDNALLINWFGVLCWWLKVPDMPSPEPADLRAWQRFVADNLEYRMGVAVGAVVAQAWAEGTEDEFAVPSLETWRDTTGLPWFGFWCRELLRWGTHDPFTAFALSQGLVRTRDEAASRRLVFEAWLELKFVDRAADAEDRIDPRLFNEWFGTLRSSDRREDFEMDDDATVTGTDGRRGRYGVVPVGVDGTVRWLDAAGFELAQGEDENGEFANASGRDDYELHVSTERSWVTKPYAAPARRTAG